MAGNTDKATQEVVNHFRNLREEQQKILNEIKIIEGDLRELHGVLTVLGKLDEGSTGRFKIGDVMGEADTKVLMHEKTKIFNKLGGILLKLNAALIKKSEEITAYKQTHNIRILTEEQVRELERQQRQMATAQAAK